MTVQDAIEISDIDQRTYSVGWWGSETFLRHRTSLFSSRSYAAEQCGIIVGYAIVQNNSILRLVVAYHARNKGVGSKILEAIKKDMEEESLDIRVHLKNILGCKFLRKKGFVADQTRTIYTNANDILLFQYSTVPWKTNRITRFLEDASF